MSVSALPLKVRSCFDCQHFEFEEDVNLDLNSRCVLWGDRLDDESVAAECPDFQLSEGTS